MECPSQSPPGMFDFMTPHDSSIVRTVAIFAGVLVAGVLVVTFFSLKLHRTVPEGRGRRVLFWQLHFAQALGLVSCLLILLILFWLGTLGGGYPLLTGKFPLFDALGCGGGPTQAAYAQSEYIFFALAGFIILVALVCLFLLLYSSKRLHKLARSGETP